MKQIQNVQTKDYIAEAIRGEILAGHMEAGEELTQEALAETLGVSRMPVREALQTLVQEGFVERLPNRHMQVVALDGEQIEETFEVIAAMETKVAELLIKKDIEIEGLEELYKKAQNTEKPEILSELEMSFHRHLIELLDNKYLAQTYGKLMGGYVSYTIENMGEKEHKADFLCQLCEVIMKKEKNKISGLFAQYYEYYSELFRQKVKT